MTKAPTFLTEIERKFLIKKIGKDCLWQKEFLIFQWFSQETEYETKVKLIIDMCSFSHTWVTVSKNRISHTKCEKVIKYIDINDFKLKDFIGRKFIAKRRSFKDKICIDRFIFSNSICEYLVEDEGEDELFVKFCCDNDILIEKEVTSDYRFKNINMAITFDSQHLFFFEILLKLYVK